LFLPPTLGENAWARCEHQRRTQPRSAPEKDRKPRPTNRRMKVFFHLHSALCKQCSYYDHSREGYGRMWEITDEQLIDLAEGRLRADEAVAMRQRANDDPDTWRRLRAIEELIALMRSDDSVDAPAHVVARALRLMRRPAPAAAPGLLQRLTAALRSDSRTLPVAAGVRAGVSEPRSLTYGAADWVIDLQLTPRGGRWQLQGQLIGAVSAGSVVLSGTRSSSSTTISQLLV
jgi:hypothetical protein